MTVKSIFVMLFIYGMCSDVWCHFILKPATHLTFLPALNATFCFQECLASEKDNVSSVPHLPSPPLECVCSEAYLAHSTQTCEVCCYKGNHQKMKCKPICTHDVPLEMQKNFLQDIKQIFLEYMKHDDPLTMQKNQFALASQQKLGLPLIGVPDMTEESVLQPEEPPTSEKEDDIGDLSGAEKQRHRESGCILPVDTGISHDKPMTPSESEQFYSHLNDMKIRKLRDHNV